LELQLILLKQVLVKLLFQEQQELQLDQLVQQPQHQKQENNIRL
jgi:hypothetical protein